MKILLIKTSSMGDVIHTLPVINDILSAIPNAQIDWLVETPFDQIPSLHRGINQTIPISWRKWRKHLYKNTVRKQINTVIHKLRVERYDLAIDLQGLLKSALWARWSRAKVIHGFSWQSAREPVSSLSYHFTHTVSKNLLAIERSRILCAAALNYSVPDSRSFGIEPPTIAQGGWKARGAYCAFVHGSSDDARLWQGDNWIRAAQLAHQHGLNIVLIWGSDAELVRSNDMQAQMAILGIQAQVPPFLTIAQTANVLAASRVVLGLDTGFTHLAAALGAPTVSLHCTHDPARTGVQGNSLCIALGAIGQMPSFELVSQALLLTLVNPPKTAP